MLYQDKVWMEVIIIKMRWMGSEFSKFYEGIAKLLWYLHFFFCLIFYLLQKLFVENQFLDLYERHLNLIIYFWMSNFLFVPFGGVHIGLRELYRFFHSSTKKWIGSINIYIKNILINWSPCQDKKRHQNDYQISPGFPAIQSMVILLWNITIAVCYSIGSMWLCYIGLI